MINETGARWMVVDDDTHALDTVAQLLAAVSAAQISSFASPWQALDALAAAPEKIDLVVTDFEMPGMNGIDFRRHVEMLSPSNKVLLATGSGLFSDESARENGFCGLLCKPFSIGVLKQALAELAAADCSNFSMTT
jgi:two-component system, cell cycle sensor histidine kinase and response regulator CckA